MKSYISRKFPLETRTTDQIFAFRSAERLIGSNGSQSWPFVMRRRGPPVELNSPQFCVGHPACSLETARLSLPRGGPGSWPSFPYESLHTFKDESVAKLAQKGHSGGGSPGGRLPSARGMTRSFTRPALIPVESGVMR